MLYIFINMNNLNLSNQLYGVNAELLISCVPCMTTIEQLVSEGLSGLEGHMIFS